MTETFDDFGDPAEGLRWLAGPTTVRGFYDRDTFDRFLRFWDLIPGNADFDLGGLIVATWGEVVGAYTLTYEKPVQIKAVFRADIVPSLLTK